MNIHNLHPDEPSDTLICAWCGWSNPTNDDFIAGVVSADGWFCADCVAGGHDHLPTDDEMDEWGMAEDYPKLYAELVALRQAASS